jgi:predicted AAA+ superfamily ATPase
LRLFVDQVTLAWERYVLIGGFPRAVADVKNGIDVQRATADGMWDILTGDVLHVGEMSDRDVKHFITALTDTLSSFLNVTSLSSTLSIGTRHTVENRIDRLCKSFFAWRVQTSHDGSTVVKGSHDKLYFIDPLIARLPSLRSSGVAGPDVTKLAEQALGVTLMRTILKEDVRPILDEDALLVRRNPDSGAEIDFVGPHLATPVESKYVSDKWKPEKKALTEHYGRGVIVTRDILDMTEDIWAVPAGLFAWALDD